MIDIIAGITGSLNAAKTIAGGLIELRDANKLAAVQSDLTHRILQAQAQLGEVLAAIIEKDARVAGLQERVRELERKQLERDRYELCKLSADGDSFAYRLKAPSEPNQVQGEIAHFACQPCMDVRGVKSVLQGVEFYGRTQWRCSVCNAELIGERTT